MKTHLITTAIIAVLSFGSMAQTPGIISNASFETWDTIPGYNNPRGWSTLNSLVVFDFEPSTRKTTDSHTGLYAAELISTAGVFSNLSGVICTGPILNSSFEPDFSQSGVAYTQRPDSLTFWYKAFPEAGDTCAAVVALTKWNTTTSRTDTIAVAEFGIGTVVNTYTQAVMRLTYFSTETPDTLFAIFSSSLDGFNPTPGSRFVIDDIVIHSSQQTGVHDLQAAHLQCSAYPNPASVGVAFEVASADGDLIIYDASGKLMTTISSYTGEWVDIRGWEMGLYIAYFCDAVNGTIRTSKFIKRIE